MTTETPGPDAFEQRLAGVLAAHAGDLTPPDDGLDRVRHRVVHRRRARRATWLAAAAVLVLVAGFVGVALSSNETDSAPSVDTDTYLGGMPLLGFDTDTWIVTSYTPGGGYGVSRDRDGMDPQEIVLTVRRVDSGYPDPDLQISPDGSEQINGLTVDRATLTTTDDRGQITYRSPALIWSPTPGYQAMVVGTSSMALEGVTQLRAAVSDVVEVDLVSWEMHLRSESQPVEPPSEHPMLGLLEPDGSTQLISVNGDAVLALLTSEGNDVRSNLNRLSAGLVVDQATTTPIEVRGTEGRFLERGTGSTSQLSWIESGETYLLSVPWGTTAPEAAAIADRLERMSLEQWQALLFPTEPIDMRLLVEAANSLSGP